MYLELQIVGVVRVLNINVIYNIFFKLEVFDTVWQFAMTILYESWSF